MKSILALCGSLGRRSGATTSPGGVIHIRWERKPVIHRGLVTLGPIHSGRARA